MYEKQLRGKLHFNDPAKAHKMKEKFVVALRMYFFFIGEIIYYELYKLRALTSCVDERPFDQFVKWIFHVAMMVYGAPCER